MMWLWPSDESITIEWGGLSFQSIHDRDESPRWRLGGTDWWNGGTTDPDTIRAPRGMWVGEDHFAARTVSWSGLLKCADRDELLEEMQALQSAHGTTLRVWEVVEARQAACRRGQVQVTPISDRHATYSVTVILDDPLISSIDGLVLDRSVKVTNRGAVRARPVVSVTASGQRPTVTIGSWSTRAPRNLSSGEVFTVDCRTETVYLGNDPVFPILPSFPSIRPGATATISTSHGSGTVDGVSAWI